MGIIRFADKELQVDDAGFIQDFDAWSLELAQFLADAAGMGTLTPNHLRVIYFLREYYRENELAPPIRLLCRETGFKLNVIYQLFPAGPARGACKIAGLPKPTGCA
jgi:dissimilatory sulfite reductase related protein